MHICTHTFLSSNGVGENHGQSCTYISIMFAHVSYTVDLPSPSVFDSARTWFSLVPTECTCAIASVCTYLGSGDVLFVVTVASGIVMCSVCTCQAVVSAENADAMTARLQSLLKMGDEVAAKTSAVDASNAEEEAKKVCRSVVTCEPHFE